NDPAIWATGDIANYPDPVLGRTRVEHVDNAIAMGKAAGRIMAGSKDSYTHTPMMYSQIFGVRWEAVGTLDSSLATTSVEAGDGQVVYYLSDGKPVGVLLWNRTFPDAPTRPSQCLPIRLRTSRPLSANH
ncbi:hypothetical protein VSR68_42650, partial [Paraburkholderia phymatum]